MKARYVAVISVALCLSACGSDDKSVSPAPASATTARAVPSGLEAPVQQIAPGKQRVPFDPCLDIDEETLRKMGLDPATRKRRDQFNEVAVLGCRVDGPTRHTTLMATNSAFENEWNIARDRAQLTKVNGREAFVGLNAINPDGCTLVMRTPFGEVIVDTNNLIPGASDPLPPACDGVPEMSSVIEPLIPKEN
ncbi:DUF3558 family protein [Antrihabitans cavernicola]|uniref:DUF3558 family protein n=1 Tax=Antrihabitans cavernicola TaxID=2495913 RepID=UPI0016598870